AARRRPHRPQTSRYPQSLLYPPGNLGRSPVCIWRPAAGAFPGDDKGSGTRLMASNNAEKKPSVSADEGSVFSTIRNLWPYMWPETRPDLRTRVMLALAALIVSKVATTFIPFIYKGIIDSLDSDAANSALVLGVAMPVMLVVAYGVACRTVKRSMRVRRAAFSRVRPTAVRLLANVASVPMHELSLRHHLRRRRGRLSRAIGRAIKRLATIVRFTLLNIVPTMI